MAKTITLQDIRVLDWAVNVALRNVTVTYRIMDSNGDVVSLESAVFWETIPDPVTDPINAGSLNTPSNWYQLPAKYSQVLTDLTQDVRSGLLHLIN